MINLSGIKEAFPQVKIPDGGNYYSCVLPLCIDIYGGQAPWLEVKRSGLYKSGIRKMNSMNMAKQLCDELASLTFGEQAEINISDEGLHEFVQSVLNENGFYSNIPSWLSYAYAMGGGVLKVYYENGRITIDYITADNFIPVSYTNKSINGGIIGSSHVRGQDHYTLYESYIHRGDTTAVEHRLFRSADKHSLGAAVPLSELIDDAPPERIVFSSTDSPLFAYFKPAVSNNIEHGLPLGLSVFYNCIDTLKALDTAFDSFCREFILGRKRIIVPSSCIRTVVDPETGDTKRYFDADDEVYQAMKCDEEKDLHISDNTMTLRISEHVDGINALLNILCCQTGLSAGTFDFSASGGVKTATEIISENSKTFRTAKSNKNMLSAAFSQLAEAILSLGRFYGLIPDTRDYEITVSFSDNIIEDDNTIIDNSIKLVSAGLMSKLSAIMAVSKCDEETARKELERINSEYGASGGDDYDAFAEG